MRCGLIRKTNLYNAAKLENIDKCVGTVYMTQILTVKRTT